MIKIRKVLSELRGALGGYGFAQLKTEGTKGAYPFADKEKQYRGYSDDELAYAKADASDASKNMKGHDVSAENWYRDDVSTIGQEIQRRRGKKSKTEDDTSLQDTAAFHKEMKDHLISRFKGLVGDEESDDFNFDLEAAIYWFANDHHSGQSDQLYAVLSQSKYNPSQFTNSVETESELVNELYKELVKAFGRGKAEPTEARAPSATTAMSSGRYIGQVLGNVIGDIEKGRVPSALDLLKKLKADLEKAGTEVVELHGEHKSAKGEA